MWYDFVILAVLAYSAIRGAVKGFVWQVAVIAALLFCFFFSDSLSQQIAPHIALEEPFNRWVAMFLLYIGFSFLCFGAARLFRGWIEKIRFVEYDRHLGAIFGLVKGVLFALIITFFLVTFSKSMRSDIMNTKSGYYAAIIMDQLHPMMPESMHDALDPYIHLLDSNNSDLKNSHAGRSNSDQGDDDSDAPLFGDAGGDDEGLGFDDILSSSKPDFSNVSKTKSTDYEDIVSKLPGMFGAEIKKQAVNALKNTSPEDRDELIKELSSGVPGLIRQITSDWANGKPKVNANTNSEKGKLIRDIVGVYSDYPKAQNSMIEEINSTLKDLPDRIVIPALKDWKSDLTRGSNDPDPSTDYSTPLPARLMKQLREARIPRSSLNASALKRLTKEL